MSAQALELAKYPKVFTGAQGVQVVLVPSVDGKQALVRVSGVNHAIDKVVFLSTMEQRSGDRDVYSMPLDGRKHGLLHKQVSPYGGGERYSAYLPGGRNGVPLTYDDKESKSFKLSELEASYTQQKKTGVQEKLAQFDREKRLSSLQSDVSKADPDASAACDTPIQTTVNWKSIDDEKLQTLSIGSYCGVVAAELESQCRDNPKFKAVAAQLSQVQCTFASNLNIRTENRQVFFSTEKNAPNQAEFVRQFLRNQ